MTKVLCNSTWIFFNEFCKYRYFQIRHWCNLQNVNRQSQSANRQTDMLKIKGPPTKSIPLPLITIPLPLNTIPLPLNTIPLPDKTKSDTTAKICVPYFIRCWYQMVKADFILIASETFVTNKCNTFYTKHLSFHFRGNSVSILIIPLLVQ